MAGAELGRLLSLGRGLAGLEEERPIWAAPESEEEAVDAVVEVEEILSNAADSLREPSMLSDTLQRRAEVYRQNSRVYSHNYQQNSYPYNSPTDVETPKPSVETMAESQTDAKSEPLRRSLTPQCGDFVSAEYESDCARFVAEAKNLARRRVEAGLARPLVAP